MIAYYYMKDHLGSVRELCGSSGAIVARYSYDPYGRASLISGSNLASKQYAGYYEHQTSDLDLTLFRAYDSNAGRWLSRDPIEERGGINVYDYTYNRPLQMTDPTGLEPSYFPVIRKIFPTRPRWLPNLPGDTPDPWDDQDPKPLPVPVPKSPVPAVPTPTDISPNPSPKGPLTIAPYATLTRKQCEDKFDDCIMYTPWLPCLDALLHCRRTGRWPSEKCPGY